VTAPREEPHKITHYSAFWRFYLREHANPKTRTIHIGGTLLAFLFLILAAASGDIAFVLLALLAGYLPAWTAHFFVEKNRPATFRYPLWSLVSDLRMTWFWVSGRLPRELEKAGIAALRSDRH